MTFSFQDFSLTSTDYYGSTDYTRRLAWLAVHEKTWHLLLPGVPQSSLIVQAGPVEDAEEPGGWKWCLDIDGEAYELPVSRIYGERPCLPDQGRYLKRQGLVYTGQARSCRRAAFGGVHDLVPGLTFTSHRLWLTNGLKVGYKPRESARSFH